MLILKKSFHTGPCYTKKKKKTKKKIKLDKRYSLIICDNLMVGYPSCKI